MIHFCILPLCSDSSLHNKTLTLLICIVQSSVWCDIIWLPLPQIVQHTTKLSQTLTLLKCITQSSAWCDIIWLPPPPQASRATTSRDRSIPQIWGQHTFSRLLWISSVGIGCQRFGGTIFFTFNGHVCQEFRWPIVADKSVQGQKYDRCSEGFLGMWGRGGSG